jgi:hypothetical protein
MLRSVERLLIAQVAEDMTKWVRESKESERAFLGVSFHFQNSDPQDIRASLVEDVRYKGTSGRRALGFL